MRDAQISIALLNLSVHSHCACAIFMWILKHMCAGLTFVWLLVSSSCSFFFQVADFACLSSEMCLFQNETTHLVRFQGIPLSPMERICTEICQIIAHVLSWKSLWFVFVIVPLDVNGQNWNEWDLLAVAICIFRSAQKSAQIWMGC